jgi:serine/threonine protein kinase
MPEIGQTLSHYRIVEKIGQGGMGEVYLADDTTLDRKVAMKFLPEAFTSDPERMARFEREAKLLASLNHPNIAGIYGLEQADRNRFLVLEYVEGETLQARLSKGALPLEDALELCRQIAEGLEAAHEKGVIHRDLKPANVMITAEEKVKILDFGLAKALGDEIESIDSSKSPTLTEAMTRPGVILGTAAYMSPEQAKGKSVDKRADIWAFGCILYECLTGKKAFEGETVTETLAAVLKEEPDWNGLPANSPQNIRFVLRRCLEKNKKRRFRDMADVWINIEHSPDSPSTVEVSETAWPLWKKAALAIVSLIIGIAIGVAVLWNLRSPSSAEVIPFSFILPEYQFFTGALAISPDGTKLVYRANRQLFLKRISETESQPIQGTQDAQCPFFSPDGKWIGFYSSGWLKKIHLIEGTAVSLCEASYPYGASWWNHIIVFSQGSDGIYTVSENGGSSKILVEMEPGEFADGPQMLPGGDAVLFALTRSAGGQQILLWDKADVVVYSRKTGKKSILVQGGCNPHYVPTGHIIYALGNDLRMIPFDYKHLKATGSSVQVISGVARWESDKGTSMNILPIMADPSWALFDLSNDGTLAYIPVSSFSPNLKRRILALLDSSGRMDVLDLPPGVYDYPRLSPDGRELYYWSHSYQKLMAVPIQTKPTYSTGQTLQLGIEGIIQPYGGRAYDIMPYGKQFLVMLPETQTQEQPRPAQKVNFVLNWFEELKRRGSVP